MSADNIVKLVAIGLVLAHVVVALFLRRRIGWVIALNLLVSAGVVAYWLPDIAELPGYVPLVWAFVAFEVVALVISASALLARVPPALLWIVFAIHAALAVAAVVFIVTFRIDRLI
jgi:hypothetical protein